MLISELPVLRNIIELFNINRVISYAEKTEIELTMADLLDNYIMNTPLSFSSPYFHQELDEYIIKNTIQPLIPVYDDIESLEYEIDNIYQLVRKKYFSTYYPIRSYPTSFIRATPNKDKMTLKILDIEKKPQPDQRTSEWYEFRHNLITASSAWKVFKSQSSVNQLIVEKCKPIDVNKYDAVNTNTPMHHGNKYEDVSIMFYEYMYKTKVKDYGCIQHDTYKCLGASPDGINVDPSSDRYGRMVEIKNPTTREITGIPKEDYWIQMQLQMETCNLNECDFLETLFKEYDDEDMFMNDGTFTHSEEGELKGIIAYFMKNGKPMYEYMPLYNSEKQYNTWIEDKMDANSELTWVKNIYWKLEKYSCVLVLRNKYWFKHAIGKIIDVWDIIEKERITGVEHRAARKTNRSSRSNSVCDTISNADNSCLINVDNLKNQIIYIDTKYELDVSGGTN
jgi:putative phage-type endonuclease